jgi:hypothetical protein
MRTALRLLTICCCLSLLALPVAADTADDTATAAAPAQAATVAPEAPSADAGAACPAVDAGLPDALQLAPCFISVACSDGSSVSCNGNNSCSTSGTNGRCVTCDGVQQGCCAVTACEQCEINYFNCSSTCEFTFECNRCERFYDRCLELNECF